MISLSPFLIRPIELRDNPTVARIIRTVMPEFGADGPGFAIHDPEVARMYEAYGVPGAAYFVVEHAGEVRGCGGVAALEHGDAGLCELRKMYFLQELRGLGAGQALISLCLETARVLGYHACYLETLAHMHAAQALYIKNGFRRTDKPMGDTGHFSCNRFYFREL